MDIIQRQNLRKYDLGSPRRKRDHPSLRFLQLPSNHQKDLELGIFPRRFDACPQSPPPPSHHIVILTRLGICTWMHQADLISTCRFRSKIPPTKYDRLTDSHKQTRPRIPRHRDAGCVDHHPAFIPSTSRSQDADSLLCLPRPTWQLYNRPKTPTIPQPPAPSHKVGNKTRTHPTPTSSKPRKAAARQPPISAAGLRTAWPTVT